MHLEFFTCYEGVLGYRFVLGILYMLPVIAFAGCTCKIQRNCRATCKVPQGHCVLKKHDHETTTATKILPMVERT